MRDSEEQGQRCIQFTAEQRPHRLAVWKLKLLHRLYYRKQRPAKQGAAPSHASMDGGTSKQVGAVHIDPPPFVHKGYY